MRAFLNSGFFGRESRRTGAIWFAAIALGTLLSTGLASCSILFPVDCSNGSCGGGGASPDDAGGIDAPADVVPDESVAADASPDADAEIPDAPEEPTGPPNCNIVNPCDKVKPTGAYCGNSPQDPAKYFGVTDCLYVCLANDTPCTKYCTKGCFVEPAEMNDHCIGEPPATCP